jgi:hypothetical protein
LDNSGSNHLLKTHVFVHSSPFSFPLAWLRKGLFVKRL